jgi:hypothetical protein
MIELALVLVAVAAVALIGFLDPSVTPTVIAALGVGVLLLGLAVGVPTGLWYHVVLYRFVSAKIALPRRWWLSPAALHRHLTAEEARRVHPWNRVGAVGFVLCLAGGLAAIAGLLLGR